MSGTMGGLSLLALDSMPIEAAILDIVDGLKAILDGDSESFTVEYPCHSPEEERWFVLDAARFTMGDEPDLFVSHIDTTDRKLAQLQTEARSEQLETLVGVLTHDIRNPLQIIDTYAALLADELDDDRVTSIRDAVTRISEITEAALSFSRTGALSDIEPLSVDELAWDAWKSVPTADATLIIDDTQRFHGDRGLMTQLFENLFRNAVEHAGSDSTVTIGLLPDGFYVEDDGPGIPKTLRDKAVEADFSTQGLGLAIVQSVARAHGGHLQITDADSGGARFGFTGFEIRPLQTQSEPRVRGYNTTADQSRV